MKKTVIGICIGLLLGAVTTGYAQFDFISDLLNKVNKQLDTQQLQLAEQKIATANVVRSTYELYDQGKLLYENAQNIRMMYEKVRNIKDIDFENVHDVTNLILNFDRPSYWLTGMDEYTKRNLRSMENTQEAIKNWRVNRKVFYMVMDEEYKKQELGRLYGNEAFTTQSQLMADNLVAQDMSYGEQLKRRAILVEEMLMNIGQMRLSQYEQIELRNELEKEHVAILQALIKNEENKLNHFEQAYQKSHQNSVKKFTKNIYNGLLRSSIRNKP